MGLFRPHEALEVLRALDNPALPPDSALATLVAVNGAPHARSGALALVSDRRSGLVEADLSEFQTRFGFEDLFGRAELWLEPLDDALRRALLPAREALSRAEGLVMELTVAGEGAGRRRLLAPNDPDAKACYAEEEPELDEESAPGGARRVLRLPLIPMGKAAVVGDGADARRLAETLGSLGFVVSRGLESLDERTFVAVLTHDHEAAFHALLAALRSPAPYVGLAASAARASKLLAQLKNQGVSPRPDVFSAPAGLDIGAGTAEESVLAIAAEILAVRGGRKGGRPMRLRPAGSSPAARKGGVKVPGLILAAGRSRRFGGGSKMLAGVDGRPVLRHVVESALASHLEPVIVVLGAGAEAGLKAIEGIDDARLRVVFNPFWASGKASSFEVGLREIPAHAPGVVALLGDMPRVPPWLVDRVLSEFLLSGKLCFPVYPSPEGPLKGQPTAYPRELFGEVGRLIGDDTALAAVRRHWSEAVKIPLDNASTQVDIDTPRDLELLTSPAFPLSS